MENINNRIKQLGIENLSKEELEEIQNCYISISETEDIAFSATNRQDEESLKSSIELTTNYLGSTNKVSLKEKPKRYQDDDSKEHIRVDNNFNLNSFNKNNTVTYKAASALNSSTKKQPIKQNSVQPKHIQHQISNVSNSRQISNSKPIQEKNKSNSQNYNENLLNSNSIPLIDLNKILLEPEEYEMLKQKGTKELNLNQIYSLKVYEKFDALNDKYLEASKQSKAFRMENITLKEENSMLSLEKEKLLLINSSQLDLVNMKITKYESENIKLKELCDSQERKLNEVFPKISRYEELSMQLTKLQKEKEDLSEQNNKITKLNTDLNNEKYDWQKKSEHNRFEAESLQRDKIYLNKELLIKEERNLSLNEKIKSLEEEISNTRKSNEKYLDKLTDKSSFIENMYQEKLKKEIEEMNKKHDQNIEIFKKNYEDLLNSKCTFLQEERNELKIKISKLELDIKEKTNALDFINSEYRNFKNSSNEEISCLKIQLKLKSEDSNRLANLHEENLQLLKILKIENESLKEKHDLFRTELINREVLFKEETSQLKAELMMQRESKANYEKMENELDNIIVDSSLGDLDRDILQVINTVPSASKRRINQCLALAQKLKSVTLENGKLLNENNEKKELLSKTVQEKEILRDIVDKAKQP